MNKKIAITTASVLLALNMGCSSTQPKNKIEISKPVKQIEVEEKVENYKSPEREFSKFKGKKSVTLGEKNNEKNEEKTECKFTSKVKELISEIALLNLKINNKEEITIQEICNLRNVYTEAIILSNNEMNNIFTNHKKTFFDLDKRLKQVESIENYYYMSSKEYDVEREVNCFSNGEIIPMLIKLKNYSEQVKKDNLTVEDFCNINDHILSLNEIKDAAISEQQKKYIKEIMEKLELLLPKKFRKDNMYKREEDCDVLFRLR